MVCWVMANNPVSAEELPDSLPADIDRNPALSRSQRIYVSWLTDILVYTVVLNLYVEYSDAKVIDSFTISILTGVLLKGLFALITAAKHRVWGWAKSKDGGAYKAVGVFGVWLILFLSKFAILEAVDLVFGDSVELGGFLDVMLLAVGLMVASEAIRRVYIRLGATANDRT